MAKQFAYVARIHATDQFGNSYQFESDRATVTVQVPDVKVAAGVAAMAAAATAAVLYAMAGAALLGVFTAIGSPPLLAAATAAFTAAGGLGAAALDPPEPDPAFDDLVPIDEYRQPAARDDAQSGPELLFKLVSQVTGLLDAISRIEGKVLGAQFAGAEKSEAMQRDQLLDAFGLLEALASAIREIRLDGARELDEMLSGPATQELWRTWEADGLPQKLTEVVNEIASGQEGALDVIELLLKAGGPAGDASGYKVVSHVSDSVDALILAERQEAARL
jgi:hypothetical protein